MLFKKHNKMHLKHIFLEVLLVLNLYLVLNLVIVTHLGAGPARWDVWHHGRLPWAEG